MKADKDGDDYILNGQKTWTSGADRADWIFLLCRTSSEDKKQRGITFTDARVPRTNRVGDEGDGWTIAKALLGFERTGIGGAGTSGRWLRLVKRIARETPVGTGSLIDDPAFRRRIAKLQIRHRAIEMGNYRTLAAAALGKAPGPESSILKVAGTELLQEVTELTMDALGHGAMGWFDAPDTALRDFERMVPSEFNYFRAATIYGGSNEIQKNIIAKHGLGLPQG